MGLTGVYGEPMDRQEAIRVVRAAVERGITLFDTAEAYGPFKNEEVLGEALAPYRTQVVIGTKFGFGINPDGSLQDMRDRKFWTRLNRYYDSIITILRGADTILIFGPGEAKEELVRRLERAGLKERVLAVETVDKMNDREIAAKVRKRIPR